MEVTWSRLSFFGICLIVPTLLHAAQQTDALEPPVTPTSDEIRFGPLVVGGSMRVNYVLGDYPETEGASPAVRDGGNFSFDTFRIKLDLASGPYIGKLQYAWYDGYSFLHTGWLGYRFQDQSELQIGVNRVPFGPHPHYGVSQSWFFDQHYYVGLVDDMDLGIRYSTAVADWQWDIGYYLTDEGDYIGVSEDSARYSYDVVNESGGYEERHQVNLRGVYTLNYYDITNELGFSLQYGQLESQGSHDDGDHGAVSLHMINRWADFALTSQLTYYRYDVDAAQPLGTDTLVQMGAYDFPVTVAAEAWIPAVSLIYVLQTPGLGWLDSVTPYVEYSSVEKKASGFNDSELVTLGAAWANGGWYIYTDLVYSNGNEFIGGDTPFGDRLGANANDQWQARFNINFGLYF